MSKFDILRPLTPDEYTGLKADIAAHGQQYPIIRDQNGATLDGHQRERILLELHVPMNTWEVEKRSFGSDAERMAFVISANVHRRQSTAEDRKRLAERLHFEHGMSQEEIAKALSVSQGTVSNDLSEALLKVNNAMPRRDKLGRKNTGRPKSAKPSKPHKYDQATEAKAATLHLDEGVAVGKVAADLGVSEQVVIRSSERERGRREAKADPDIKREDLSLSMRAKFDAAIRQEKKRLALEHQDRRAIEIREHIEAVIIPRYQKQIDEAATLIRTRKGYMTLADWDNIRRCLHPDNSASEAKRNRAFDVWNDPRLKLVLVPEAENPASSRYPQPPPLPTSAAEWQALKDKVSAERRAKRATS